MTRVAGPSLVPSRGMTLIELLIVVAVMGILLTTAIPSYKGHMLRVHRSEAVRILLQASMCQQRIYAANGNYDTNRCFPDTGQQYYQLTYDPVATKGGTYLAMASPKNAQLADRCGGLSLDQNGARGITEMDTSVVKCWNGR